MFEIDQKAEYPKAELTAQPATELVKIKKPWWLRFYTGPLPKVSSSLPEQVRFSTDGRRIMVINYSSAIIGVIANSHNALYAAGGCVLIALITIFKGGWGYTYTNFILSLIPIFLIISLLLHLKSKKMTFNEFYIFDRVTGNVLLPKKSRCPAYSIPFSEIELYAGRAISRHGMNQYNTFLYPKQRPKGHGSCWRYQIQIDLGVFDEYTAIQHWAFLATFMDKTKPIPTISTVKEQTAVFNHYNITFDDLPYKGINEDEVEELLTNLE